jgi:hypothetical protein
MVFAVREWPGYVCECGIKIRNFSASIRALEPQISHKHFYFVKYYYELIRIWGEKWSAASDYGFPCKQPLGPPPSWCSFNPVSESFRKAICGVSTWEEHTGEQNWKVLGWRGFSDVIFALAVPAWHRTIHRTVNCCNFGKLRSSKIVISPHFINYGTYSAKRTVPYRTVHRTGHRPDYK